jgi:GH18 family chitinase
MGYNEICEELRDLNSGWNVTTEKHHLAPYMVKGVKWVSYDDEASVRKKSQFAYDQGLAGIMTWYSTYVDQKFFSQGISDTVPRRFWLQTGSNTATITRHHYNHFPPLSLEHLNLCIP